MKKIIVAIMLVLSTTSCTTALLVGAGAGAGILVDRCVINDCGLKEKLSDLRR